MLHSLTSQPLKRPEVPDPVRTCAVCGKTAPSTYYLNLLIGIGCPGDPHLLPVGCGNRDPEQHWACSIPCWKALAHACIEEHVTLLLLQAHTNLPESPHHDYAQEALTKGTP